MKTILKNIFKHYGYNIAKIHPLEKKAKVIYNKYKGFTMISQEAFIDNLLLTTEFSRIRGSIVECGVWRGGMIAGIADLIPDREFYLFDSFEGLPQAKEIDGSSAIAWQNNTESESYYNNCKAEMDFAEKAMTLTGAKHHIVKGWFNKTLPQTDYITEIAILRLDADWYDSTMDCLTNLYEKVVKGGLIIFDDYYTWDGCSRAVHDYLSETNSISRVSKTNYGVAYLIKID